MSNDDPLSPFGRLVVQLMTDDDLLATLNSDPRALLEEYPGVTAAQITLLESRDADAIEAEFMTENSFVAGGDPNHIRLTKPRITKRLSGPDLST